MKDQIGLFTKVRESYFVLQSPLATRDCTWHPKMNNLWRSENPRRICVLTHGYVVGMCLQVTEFVKRHWHPPAFCWVQHDVPEGSLRGKRWPEFLGPRASIAWLPACLRPRTQSPAPASLCQESRRQPGCNFGARQSLIFLLPWAILLCFRVRLLDK